MFSIKFFPQILQDIFQYLPTIALKTISWKSFLIKSKLILKQHSQAKGQAEIFTNFIDELKAEKIEIFAQELNSRGFETLSLQRAEKILFLFFLQLKNPLGLSLDYRANRFMQDKENLAYNYNGFYVRFEDSFRQNLWQLYENFYFGTEAEIIQSLDQIQISHQLSDSAKGELCQLFVNSFAKDKENMKFSFDEFQASFLKIFEFFLEHKIQIPVDFIFLGMSLTTLFQTLAKCQEGVDVVKVFTQAREFKIN